MSKKNVEDKTQEIDVLTSAIKQLEEQITANSMSYGKP